MDFQHQPQSTINPTTKLSVSGRFVSSDSLYKRYSYDLEDRLVQQLSATQLFQSPGGNAYNAIN
jgi:hypothetical protein